MENQLNIKPKLLNTQDAAKYIGYGRWKFWKYVTRGLIPQFQPSPEDRPMYRIEDLDDFINKHTKLPKFTKVSGNL